MSDGYRGIVGAVPYAFRRSDSYVFKSYAIVGTFIAIFVGLLFVLGVITLLGQDGGRGGTLSFSRSFVLLVGVLLVAPLLGPTLLVARRYRRGGGSTRQYDAAVAGGGYVFILTMYAAGVASMPDCFVLDEEQICRSPPSGLLEPVVATLYGIPEVAAPLILLAGAAFIGVLHWIYR